MANSHVQPSMMAETQALFGDLLAHAILSTTLTTPGSGMTLPAFSTQGYVRNGTPTRLVYVNQPAAAVTLAGGAGTYWLAIHHDTHSAVAGYTRQAGTHYLWLFGAQPTENPPGGLVWASVTVTGANITAVDTSINYPHQKVAFGGPAGQLAFDKNLTWNGSTLTAGSGQVTAHLFWVPDHPGDNQVAYQSNLNSAGGTNRWFMFSGGTAPSHLQGSLNVAGGATLSTLAVNGTITGLSTLQINGVSGFVGAPVGGYAITTYSSSQLAANVTINMLGLGATATLDVNGSVRSRGDFSSDSTGYFGGALTCQTTIYANGQIQGGSFTTGGTLYVGGVTTLQALTVYGHTHLNTTLQVQGVATFASNLNMSGSLSVGGSSTLVGNVSTSGSVTGAYVRSTQNVDADNQLNGNYLHVNVESSFARTGLAGYSIACQAIDSGSTVARKIGGGPWSDNSSRAMKRGIAAIPDALAVLLAQHGRRYEWAEAAHAAALPGEQYGFVHEEVTVEQWKEVGPGGEALLTIRGFEALCVESLRQVVERLRALEGHDDQRADRSPHGDTEAGVGEGE